MFSACRTEKQRRTGCAAIQIIFIAYGNTAQFPPDGLSTAPAATALRIVRYCLIFTAGHRIVPCRFYMYPIVYHVLHDKSIFHRQIRNFYTCPGKFCWNGARAFLGGVFPCLAVSSINESKRIPQNKKYRPRSATAGPVHHRKYRTIPA